MATHFFSTRVTQILISAITLCVTFQTQAQWQKISEHIAFSQQPAQLRFFDSNQTLLTGDDCALMFDASGNFSAVEATVKYLKQNLEVPLCYLVASSPNDDHLLGMAVIQHYYPNAKLIVNKKLAANYSHFQQAYINKLDSYEQSIELSYQRLAQLPNDEQPKWRDKLELAKSRLLRWRTYRLKSAKIKVSDSLALDLGDYPVTINAYQAHTGADLMLYAQQKSILIGGDIVDSLPYVGQGHLPKWQKLLTQLANGPKDQLILPGHGQPLTPEDLKLPSSFLAAMRQHVKDHPSQDLAQLQQSFKKEFINRYVTDDVSQKTFTLFLEAGLKRAKESK